jgi:hypothetical protein
MTRPCLLHPVNGNQRPAAQFREHGDLPPPRLLPAPQSLETITFRRQDLRPDHSGRAAPPKEASMAAANGNGGTRAQGPRCIALVGPFQAGKTTLLEAILARTGAIQRQGTVEAGTSLGDASKAARHHKMSV